MNRTPLLATLIAVGAMLASAAHAQAPNRGPGRGAGGQTLPTLETMQTQLTLTDDESAKIGPILADFVAAQTKLAAAQMEFNTARTAALQEIGAALTDPQKPQLAQAFTPRRGGGGGGPAADQPSPRNDANSQLAHQQLVAKAKKGEIDVYVEGDSIARRWGTSDAVWKANLANWNENFFGWNVADFGWGADTLQNIIWRLDNGELDGVNPKVIIFLGGTNNVGGQPGDDAKAAEIARGIKAVLTRFQQKAPNATVILTGIFPRNNSPQLYAFIKQINAIVATYADGKKVRYLDVNDKLADANGVLVPGVLNSDNLHPTPKGYQIWADGLKPILTELLGPPAKTDHAPPPSADPSAAPAG